MNAKVQVLMSSYNGEKYIRQQLDSILTQDYKNIEVLVRDDGSTDNTVTILHEYAEKHPNVRFIAGENKGVIRSFFELMNGRDLTADFYALSDQDDVWLPEKIRAAMNALQRYPNDIPILYCGEQTLVDAELRKLPYSIKPVKVIPSFGNALIENKATGCTCVMNKSLLLKLQGKIPAYTIMHDWWIYLVASCFGKVIYDQKSYILYRQHSGNAVGARNTVWLELKSRIRRFGKSKGNIGKQIQSLCDLYTLPEKEKELADRVLGYSKSLKIRIDLMFEERLYRQRKIDNIIFKVLFFFKLI